MKNFAASILLFFLSLFMNPFRVCGQEENAMAAKEGTRYADLKIKKLDKYNSRIERQQDKLLNKLKRKEKHLAHKLKNTDSLGYANLKKQPLSYDSISKVSKSDTGSTAESFSKKKNGTIDSLKGVESFVQNKSGLPSNALEVQGKNAELNTLKGKLNFRTYISQLITQRTNNLNNLQGDEGKVAGLTGIQKQVFYGKAKMNAYKEIEEDPSKAEDKAMEYLQGTEGFDKYMKNATQSGAVVPGSSGEMGQMGFQTKNVLQTTLQKNLGNNLGGFAKKMSDEVTSFQKHQEEITSNIKNDKEGLQQAKHIDKPAFKINPMRGLPFWKRFQRQYNWQTYRPAVNGTTPALIDISSMVGYRQNPSLVYGIGIVSSFGLGQSWQDIHPTFQGIGLRSFTTWEWQYGIGIYTGYERMYKQVVFTNNPQTNPTDISQSPHNSTKYSESALIGLTKKYHMNTKWDGQVQALYDIWWQQKGLRSPIILRFATLTK